jgi:hypothetical protein
VTAPDFTVGLWGFQGPTYRERFQMEGALALGINVGYAVADAGGVLTALPPGSDFPAGIDFGLLGGHVWFPGPLLPGTPELDRANRWYAAFGPVGYRSLTARYPAVYTARY